MTVKVDKGVLKPTRIISAKLQEKLLEDVCVLGEEQAIGLGKHLVHRLLWKVYKFFEELCAETEKAAISYKLVTHPLFL